MNRMIALGLSATMLAGCATAFTGSAHVDGGRPACETKCKAQGMVVAGMVYMGEYSSGCVCAVPNQTAASQQAIVAAGGGAGAAAAGVAIQTRRQQEQTR